MLEVTAYTGIGPGIHDVTVTAVTQKNAKAGGVYLRWEFTRDDGKVTSDNTSVEMTPGNKTGKRFATLTGKPTEVGQARSLTEVVGKPCTIVTELNDEGYPKIVALTAREVKPTRSKPAALSVAESEAPVKEAPDEALSDELPF